MYSQQLKLKLSGTEMGLQLRKSASSILSGGNSATPAVVATAELLMRAAISCGRDKMDGAASQRQGQCGTTRAAAKPAIRLQSYAGSRICPHKLLRSMRTRGGQPPTAPLATIGTGRATMKPSPHSSQTSGFLHPLLAYLVIYGR